MATRQRRPVQISATSHKHLKDLARRQRTSISSVRERAIERYRHESLLREHADAWSRLMQEDPEAVAAFEAQDAEWDAAVDDLNDADSRS